MPRTKKTTSTTATEKKTKASTRKPKVAKPKTTAANANTSNKTKRVSTKSITPKLSHEAIAEQAYFLYLERGMSHGNHEQDWIEAEQYLLNSFQKTNKK